MTRTTFAPSFVCSSGMCGSASPTNSRAMTASAMAKSTCTRRDFFASPRADLMNAMLENTSASCFFFLVVYQYTAARTGTSTRPQSQAGL